MDKFAIWSYIEAKPGKEQEVEEFLKSAQASIEQESGTTTFYTLKIGPSMYGTFNTFPDEVTRDAHINGPVAKVVLQKTFLGQKNPVAGVRIMQPLQRFGA